MMGSEELEGIGTEAGGMLDAVMESDNERCT